MIAERYITASEFWIREETIQLSEMLHLSGTQEPGTGQSGGSRAEALSMTFLL